jgi:hypothetical protein
VAIAAAYAAFNHLIHDLGNLPKAHIAEVLFEVRRLKRRAVFRVRFASLGPGRVRILVGRRTLQAIRRRFGRSLRHLVTFRSFVGDRWRLPRRFGCPPAIQLLVYRTLLIAVERIALADLGSIERARVVVFTHRRSPGASMLF